MESVDENLHVRCFASLFFFKFLGVGRKEELMRFLKKKRIGMNLSRASDLQKAVVCAGVGSAATVGLLTALGYLPLWFGPELKSWSKSYWGANASQFLEELERNPDFYIYRPQESNRNFIYNLPTSSEEEGSRQVRWVVYFSRKHLTLKGVVHFGPDCEGPPRSVHGGCSAAVLDAIAGIAAYRTARMPCVTANLSVNYREKIPLGSQVGVEVNHVCNEGNRKSRFTFRLFSLRNPEKTLVDGNALFINAVVPSQRSGLPPFLALK